MKAMMINNPLLERLKAVRQEGRMALCGYFLAGYPTPDKFFHLVRAAKLLDVIEYGIPADEPRLDGPVIANAHQLTTERGIHTEPALALIGGLSSLPQPSFVMIYAAVGRALDGFLRLCVENGVAGVLAPDADPEEMAFVASHARNLGLASITLLDARADETSFQRCVEFSDVVYLKAATGATGQSLQIDGELHELLARAIQRIRHLKPDLPIAVGIGLQRPEQLAALAALDVDMAIVGTKIVEYVQSGETELLNYLESLHQATWFK